MARRVRSCQKRLLGSATVAMEVPFCCRTPSEQRAALSRHWPGLAAGQAAEAADGWYTHPSALAAEWSRTGATEMEDVDMSAAAAAAEARRTNMKTKRWIGRRWDGLAKWHGSEQTTAAVRACLETDNRRSFGVAARPSHTHSADGDTEADPTERAAPAHNRRSSLAGVGLAQPSVVEVHSCAVGGIEPGEAASSTAACMEGARIGGPETAHTVVSDRTRSAECGEQRLEIHGRYEPSPASTCGAKAGWATNDGWRCSLNAACQSGP
jgi:hypothetical protein